MTVKYVETKDIIKLYNNNNNDNNSTWVLSVRLVRTLVTLYRMTTTEIMSTIAMRAAEFLSGNEMGKTARGDIVV